MEENSFMVKLLTPSIQRHLSSSQVPKDHHFSEKLALHGPWRNNTLFEESAKLKREEQHLIRQTQKMEALGDAIEADLQDIKRMQAAVRRKQKRVATFMLHTASAIIIQAVWRSHLGRKRAWRRRKRLASRLIFEFFKFHHHRLVEKRAVILIQAMYRGHLGHNTYLRLRSTLKLQAVVRGRFGRKRAHHHRMIKLAVPNFVRQYIEAGTKRMMKNIIIPNISATIIQHAWKLFKRRCSAKQRRLIRMKHQMRKKGIDFEESCALGSIEDGEETTTTSHRCCKQRYRSGRSTPVQMMKRPVMASPPRSGNSSGISTPRRRKLATPILESNPRNFTPKPKKHTTIWVKLQNQGIDDPVTMREAVDELIEFKRTGGEYKKDEDEAIGVLKTLKPMGHRGSISPDGLRSTPHRWERETPGPGVITFTSSTGRRQFDRKGRRLSTPGRRLVTPNKPSIRVRAVSAASPKNSNASSNASSTLSFEGRMLYEDLPEQLKGSGKRLALLSRDRLPEMKGTNNAHDQTDSPTPQNRGSWSMLERRPIFCSRTLANGVFLEGTHRPDPRPPSGPYSGGARFQRAGDDEYFSSYGRNFRVSSPVQAVMFDWDEVEQQVSAMHAPASSPKMHAHYVMKTPTHKERADEHSRSTYVSWGRTSEWADVGDVHGGAQISTKNKSVATQQSRNNVAIGSKTRPINVGRVFFGDDFSEDLV